MNVFSVAELTLFELINQASDYQREDMPPWTNIPVKVKTSADPNVQAKKTSTDNVKGKRKGGHAVANTRTRTRTEKETTTATGTWAREDDCGDALEGGGEEKKGRGAEEEGGKDEGDGDGDTPAVKRLKPYSE